MATLQLTQIGLINYHSSSPHKLQDEIWQGLLVIMGFFGKATLKKLVDQTFADDIILFLSESPEPYTELCQGHTYI